MYVVVSGRWRALWQRGRDLVIPFFYIKAASPGLLADFAQSRLCSLNVKHCDKQEYLESGSPLAGWGVGLPLGRLYARQEETSSAIACVAVTDCFCFWRYLGGSLELMNVPGTGVDAPHAEIPWSFGQSALLPCMTAMAAMCSKGAFVCCC